MSTAAFTRMKLRRQTDAIVMDDEFAGTVSVVQRGSDLPRLII